MQGLKWENGSVTLTLSPYTALTGVAIDFMPLDGSVSYSLHFKDATADAVGRDVDLGGCVGALAGRGQAHAAHPGSDGPDAHIHADAASHGHTGACAKSGARVQICELQLLGG